jgi:flagellin
LDLINSFTDDTGVVASAYFKKVIDMSQTTFVTDNKVKINGVDINYGSDLAGTVTNINAQKSLTGITAEASGNNLILKGDGVQTANIENVEFELSSSTKQASARRSTDTAGQTQSVTFSTADLTAGRVVTLTIVGDTAGAGLSSTSVTFSHTVRSTDSAADVAKAFRDLLLVSIQNNDQMSAGSAGTYLSADASGALLFKTAMSIGSATITIGVTQTTAANLMTSVAAGTTATYYAALRLQSTANSPISIEMGESATASEGGFLETNVGDSTWDVNTATANLEAYGASAPVSGMSVATSSAAQTAIEIVDGALSTVSDVRADLGAIQNRLDHTVSNLANVVENTSAAQSRIQDADFALEAAALARAQILQQAGTAMLAQANAAPQNVLSLLS